MMLLAATLILPLLVRPIDLRVKPQTSEPEFVSRPILPDNSIDHLAALRKIATQALTARSFVTYRVSTKKVRLGLHVRF